MPTETSMPNVETVVPPATHAAVCPSCLRVPKRWTRGYCQTCYQRLRMSGKIEVRRHGQKRPDRPFDPPRPPRYAKNYHEPTTAELDVMIAEQMKCLPPWWAREVERMMGGHLDPEGES